VTPYLATETATALAQRIGTASETTMGAVPTWTETPLRAAVKGTERRTREVRETPLVKRAVSKAMGLMMPMMTRAARTATVTRLESEAAVRRARWEMQRPRRLEGRGSQRPGQASVWETETLTQEGHQRQRERAAVGHPTPRVSRRREAAARSC
jgi:hypothetical protein